MPKCKFCGENITKFDKEICPFCGGKKPLEGNDTFTSDITQTINTVDKVKVNKFKERKKLVNALLCMFLGIFGADSIYLGKIKLGISRLLVSAIYISALFCLLYFMPTGLNLGFCLLISIGSIFLVYFAIGISYLFVDGKKDVNGVYLR